MLFIFLARMRYNLAHFTIITLVNATLCDNISCYSEIGLLSMRHRVAFECHDKLIYIVVGI